MRMRTKLVPQKLLFLELMPRPMVKSKTRKSNNKAMLNFEKIREILTPVQPGSLDAPLVQCSASNAVGTSGVDTDDIEIIHLVKAVPSKHTNMYIPQTSSIEMPCIQRTFTRQTGLARFEVCLVMTQTLMRSNNVRAAHARRM